MLKVDGGFAKLGTPDEFEHYSRLSLHASKSARARGTRPLQGPAEGGLRSERPRFARTRADAAVTQTHCKRDLKTPKEPRRVG